MLDGHLLSERYRIKHTIGGGGMANVYLARDIILERDVAIKVLRMEYANDPEFIARFDREAQAATSLSHPNIVNIYDVGEENHILYMVMEYVDGMTLKEYIQEQGPVPVEQALEIMKQLTAAISHAHANGLIHRDIKPQNVLVDKYGNVKITDFGIAMALTATSLTQTNSIVGSVHYLSPEQARGGTATKKSDIYSLGIVLFELLTGHLPFSGQSPVSIALKHLQNETPSVKSLNEAIPQSVENIVLKATVKNPLYRYDSAYDMELALNSALDPEQMHVEIFRPPVEDGEETKVIPIIRDESFQQSVESDETTQVIPPPAVEEQPKKKKKNIFKNKVFITFLILFFIAIIGTIVYFVLFNVKDVEIPDVIGYEYEEAEDVLTDLNLLVEQELTYSEDVEEGIVMRTRPSAERVVKEGTTVTVIVSQGQSKVEFDDYVGKNFSQVERLLDTAGYQEVRAWKVNSDLPVGEIVAQIQPEPGEEVIPGETIVIFEVSDGPELITVEDLTGLTIDEAEDLVKEHQFELSISEEYSDSVEEGKIIRQTPKANTEVEIGSTIRIVVSKGARELPPMNQSVKFTVPYTLTPDEQPDSDNDDGDDGDEDGGDKQPQQPESPREQTVVIYVEDMNNNLSDVYLEDKITQDKEYTISLIIAPNTTATYKVVRDGTVIIESDIPFKEN